MDRPDSGLLELGALRLEYRWLGPGPDAAPTLVLLHEGLGSVAQWRDFPERLAAASGLGVFVYSRAGYGGSSPCVVPRPLTYMHDEAKETLPRLLDAIGFRAGLLVGHSDGASIAAIYAGARDDARLRGLVLMAPHFFTEDMGIAAIARAREAYETGELRARLAKYHGDNVDCAFRGWNGAWLDPGFRKWDLREFLPTIRVPVLVLQGEGDEYGTAEQLEAARRGCGGPVHTLLLPDCGHAPQRDQPERTLGAITDFLERLDLSVVAGRRDNAPEHEL